MAKDVKAASRAQSSALLRSLEQVPKVVPGRGGAIVAVGPVPKVRAVHGLRVVLHSWATMVRLKLDDRQWQKIATFLAADNHMGRPPKDDRSFIEAVIWWRRTGAPWRDLPSEFGPWQSVFNRFDRWAKIGKWQRLFEALRDDVDPEWFSIDSTINRAHQHAAGGKGGPKPTPSGGPEAARQRRFT